MGGITWMLSTVVAVLIAVFLNFPPPALSPRLLKWKDSGIFITINNLNIFYIDIKGEGSSPPVVCLHGYPTSSYDWVKILPELKSQFSRVIMLDFLGFGFSDKPEEDHTYTIAEQADFVESLLASLDVTSSHVLSHDYGDTVALELLARHNDQSLTFSMKSLMMLNGGIFPDTHRPRWSQKLLLMPYVGHAVSHVFSLQVFKIGFGEIFGINKPTPEDYEDFWASLRNNEGDKASYKVINFLRDRQEFKGRYVGALTSTKLAVLMVYGPADPVNPPIFGEHFRRVVPHQKLVTLDPSIGHYPQWEEPDRVSAEVKAFVRQLEAQG